MIRKVDIKSDILCGNDLRVLLFSDHISYGEVQALLKEKGIYIGLTDKSTTVPLLSTTLLTPENFTRLIEASIDRESKPKIKVSALVLKEATADWVSPIRDKLFEGDPFAKKLSDNYSFSLSPQVVVEKDKVRIPYSVNRLDFGKDWLQRDLTFAGEVVVQQVGEQLRLDLSTTHSSKETEALNRVISKRISKVLNEASLVTSEDPDQVRFSSFSNEERVRFFKRLTAGVSKRLTDGQVDNIEIELDGDGSALPEDPKVSWMKGSVQRLKVDGKKLNDIFLISDEKYYPYYLIQKMVIDFKFAQAANAGRCRVAFYFSSPGRLASDLANAELTFEIESLHCDKPTNSDAKRIIQSELNVSIQGLIDSTFQRTLTDRATKAEKTVPAAVPVAPPHVKLDEDDAVGTPAAP